MYGNFPGLTHNKKSAAIWSVIFIPKMTKDEGKGMKARKGKEIINTLSILKKRKLSAFISNFFAYINSRAHSYTVT